MMALTAIRPYEALTSTNRWKVPNNNKNQHTLSVATLKTSNIRKFQAQKI